MRSVRVRILGKVQGVFFRQSTRSQALVLGLCGWVKNCLNGSVEALFQGPDEALDQILSWCQHGPDCAVVEDIVVLCLGDCTNPLESFTIVVE
tara:strand:- start:343 stop:621 length:279 start_codon:yes stop_codon:yes gene_type:complete